MRSTWARLRGGHKQRETAAIRAAVIRRLVNDVPDNSPQSHTLLQQFACYDPSHLNQMWYVGN
jgi:hypothetical protein